MAFSAKVGSFDTGTGAVSSTVAVSGLGFQPKAVIFWWSGVTGSSDTVSAGSIRPGFGMASGATQRFCVSGISLDGVGSSDSAKTTYTDAAVAVLLDTSTVDGLLDLASLDSDGFTMVVDNQFGTSYRISYLALGGTDITNALVGNVALNTGTGNQSVSGLGFQPTAAIFAAAITTTLGAITATNVLSVGVAAGAAMGVIFGNSRDAQNTMDTFGYGYDGEVLATGGSTSTTIRASLVSFDATGFTINILETNGAAQYMGYLLLAGPQVAVGDLLTQTDTTTDITETLSFQPGAVLLLSANRAKSTQDTLTAHDRMSIGAFTAADNEETQGWSDEDGLADAETAFGVEHDCSYIHVKDDALEASMHCTSVSGSGFVMRMVDADASQAWVTYLALGAAASGDASVSAVTATATGAGLAPTVSGGANVAGALATASGEALASTISGGATVAGVLATASGEAIAPAVAGGASVTSVTATASAEAYAPSVSGSGGVTVAAVTATASAQAYAPGVSGGASVAGAIATANGAGLAPVVAGGANVAGAVGTGSAQAYAPTVSGGIGVNPPTATATAEFLTPAVAGVQNVVVLAPCAQAAALFCVPEVFVPQPVVEAWTLDERNLAWTLDERNLVLTVEDR